MAAATPYERAYGFAAWQAQHPSEPLPGDEVDVELDAIAASVSEVIAALTLIQRSDGKIANGSVTQDSLDATVVALFTAIGVTPRGAWVTATAYALKDVTVQSGAVYLCITAHTSGVFATDLAAGKWALLSNKGANQNLDITDTPTFAAMVLTGELNAATVRTDDVVAPQTFGSSRTTAKNARAPGSAFDLFTIPVTLTNKANYVSVKVAAATDDSSTGYASEFSEWSVYYGSYGGAYQSPVCTRTIQDKHSVNSAVIDLSVTLSAVIGGGFLTIRATLNSAGASGFLTGQLMAHAEHLGTAYQTPITKV